MPEPEPQPEPQKNRLFEHENLIVYQVAMDFVVLVKKINDTLPKGYCHLADQLFRAGTSVPFNIAEGAGEFSSNEKNRFYRIARRSATECASILEVFWRLRDCPRIANCLDSSSFPLEGVAR